MEKAEELLEEFMQFVKEQNVLTEEQLSSSYTVFKDLLLPGQKDLEEYSKESIEKLIEQTIEKSAHTFTEEEKEKQKQVLRDVFIQGKAPHEAFHIGQSELEALFQTGRRLFQTGHYDEAIEIFEGLDILKPYSPPTVFSVAACYHAKKEYAKAAGWYYFSAKMEPDSPLPLFYMSDCLNHLELSELAKSTMQKCIALSEKNPAYAQIGERVKMMAKQLEEAAP